MDKNINSQEKQKGNDFSVNVDSSSVKKLIHGELKGYREYEMKRLSFKSTEDYAFYKSVSENKVEDIKEMMKDGHKPDGTYKEEIVRLITRDRIYVNDFDRFKKQTKDYEVDDLSEDNISIVEKIKTQGSILGVALKKNSLDVANELVKSGAQINQVDKESRMLSDYQNKSFLDIFSDARVSRYHVVTLTNTDKPILNNLVEKNNIDGLKSFIENNKDKIDLNATTVQERAKMKFDGPASWEVYSVPTKGAEDLKALAGIDNSKVNSELPVSAKKERIVKVAIELAVERKNFDVAKLLKDKGADIKLMSRDSRKAFRKLEAKHEKMLTKSNSTNNMIDRDIKNSQKKDRTV